MHHSHGFTLIELLVAIAIIGILSTVVLASVVTARNNALTTTAKANLAQFRKIVIMARNDTGKTLLQLSGNGCSRCATACASPNDLRHVPDTNGCQSAWHNSLTNIQNRTSLGTSLANLERDPWGSPYLMDENEGEFVAMPCSPDSVSSVGPDGVSGTGDEIAITIPNSLPACTP